MGFGLADSAASAAIRHSKTASKWPGKVPKLQATWLAALANSHLQGFLGGWVGARDAHDTPHLVGALPDVEHHQGVGDSALEVRLLMPSHKLLALDTSLCHLRRINS